MDPLPDTVTGFPLANSGMASGASQDNTLVRLVLPGCRAALAASFSHRFALSDSWPTILSRRDVAGTLDAALKAMEYPDDEPDQGPVSSLVV